MKSEGRMVRPPFFSASTWDAANASTTAKLAISIARKNALIFLVPGDIVDVWPCLMRFVSCTWI